MVIKLSNLITNYIKCKCNVKCKYQKKYPFFILYFMSLVIYLK